MNQIKKPYKTYRIKERCEDLPRQSALAVAISSSNYVMPYFEKMWPENKSILIDGINLCWSIIEGYTITEFHYKEILDRLNSIVFSSDDFPDAGSAIPSGESVIASFMATNGKTSPYEGILCAYTAVEMDVYLKGPVSGVESSGPRSQMSLIDAYNLAWTTTQFKNFILFLDKSLTLGTVNK